MPGPRKLTRRPSPDPPAAGKTMNGGVLLESHSPLPAPALKAERITEHYAVTAKRSSQKDKMNRQLKVNTTLEPPHPSFGPVSHPVQPPQYPPAFPSGPPPPSAPGYYPPHHGPPHHHPGQQLSPLHASSPHGPPPPGPPHGQLSPQQGYRPYPPSGPPGPMSAPAAGPSRQHFPPMPPHMHHAGAPFPPQWDNASVASSASSHKRKRSDSSRDENRTPRSSISTVGPPHAQQRTPPTSGTHEALAVLPEEPQYRKKGVYVTATEEEGRKLCLVQNSTGTEPKEQTPLRGPPRLKHATRLSVSSSGKAALGTSEVLQSDLEQLEKDANAPKTPSVNGNRRTSGGAQDTPGTKADKMTRRLSAFNLANRPSEPMYSIRLDMGQGQPCRVALRKDLALAFVGLDKTTQVVEEARKEDEDGWAVVNGAPGSRPPARPNWPDEEGPWKVAIGSRGARQLREEKQRAALLRRYLETSSDDEEDDDGAGRFPSHRGKAAGRRPTQLSPGNAHATSDAKAALVSALHRTRRARQRFSAPPPVYLPNGVVNCVCKNIEGGSLVSCVSCKTWSHIGCVGIEDPQHIQNWVCDPCVVQARRATLSSPTGRTPSATRFQERSQAAFRGGDVALALAPSPMFAGDSGMVPNTPIGTGIRTPYSPTRRSHRARVLSYGTDMWGGVEDSPTTPVPPPRGGVPDHFSTPRPDDAPFDVNSTPSRHLNTDPRMAGQFNSLFPVTPLMGRARNVSGMLIADTPGYATGGATRRNVSGGQHPFSDTGVVSRHDFLQGLTAERRPPATEGPASPTRRAVMEEPESPSPFASMPSGQFRPRRRSGSRAGLGIGMPESMGIRRGSDH